MLGFLGAGKEYLTGDWTLAKVLLSSLVSISLTALALAFWKRSLVHGSVVLNAMALGKIASSFFYGDASGELAALAPSSTW